jgi:CheY-like chemotaxis protein
MYQKSPVMDDIVELLFKMIFTVADCENMALRLKNTDDYPFIYYQGFSRSFIESANSICVKGENGKTYLKCVCGAVIEGNNGFTKNYCTKFGSYLSNKFYEDFLLHKKHIRFVDYHCSKEGFETVVLVPVKTKEENKNYIGLFIISDAVCKYVDDEKVGKLETLSVYFAQVLKSINSIISCQKKHQVKIVIVDDEDSIASLLSRVLSSVGHICEVASNGMEALEYINSEKFDLIITDISMPVMDGIELIKTVRQRYGVYGPKIIIFSGSDEFIDSQFLEDNDILVYLNKPLQSIYTIEEIIRKSV